jgi:hypothetical protein
MAQKSLLNQQINHQYEHGHSASRKNLIRIPIHPISLYIAIDPTERPGGARGNLPRHGHFYRAPQGKYTMI